MSGVDRGRADWRAMVPLLLSWFVGGGEAVFVFCERGGQLWQTDAS